MRSVITIDFKRINGRKIDDSVIEETPKILEVAEDTIRKMCETMKQYLLEHKIKTTIKFEVSK